MRRRIASIPFVDPDRLAHDDPQRLLVLEDGAEHALYALCGVREHVVARGHVARRNARHRLAVDGFAHALEEVLDDAGEHLALAVEVLVERAARDAELVADVADVRLVIAAEREDPLGRREDLTASLGPGEVGGVGAHEN